MTKKIRIILIVVIVLFIAGMAFYPSLKSFFFPEKESKEMFLAKNTGGNSRKPLNVNAEIVKYEDMDDPFETKGNILPDEEVDLSFETSGKIVSIFFKEGSNVKKGQLLAKVNDEPLQAELRKLEAQIPLAEDRVYRQKALLAKDAVSKEAYEQVTTELGKLNADIDLVKANIAQTELRAPFDGIIGLRLVSEGQYASPSTVIAKLTKIIPLKIEFSINEKQVNRIGNGTLLNFQIENDLSTYQAAVYAVESRLDLKTHTLKARAIFPNTNGKLKPGRTATITINLQKIKNTLTAPNEAIIAEMGRSIAYIYKNGTAQRVELTKGLRTESRVQITQGLNAGDTLIISGVMQLRNDMPVTLDNITNN